MSGKLSVWHQNSEVVLYLYRYMYFYKLVMDGRSF